MFTTLQEHPHVTSVTAAQTKSMLVQKIINCLSRLVKDVNHNLCAFQFGYIRYYITNDNNNNNNNNIIN